MLTVAGTSGRRKRNPWVGVPVSAVGMGAKALGQVGTRLGVTHDGA